MDVCGVGLKLERSNSGKMGMRLTTAMNSWCQVGHELANGMEVFIPNIPSGGTGAVYAD